MKKIILILLSLYTCLLSFQIFADDQKRHINNDLSFLSGSIDASQHIYYPGDSIDIRVTVKGDIGSSSGSDANLYLALIDTEGSISAIPVKGGIDSNGTKQIFLEDISSSVISPGTYQLALIATEAEGSPFFLQDWLNGFAGLLDLDAIVYSETMLDGDYDFDGEWDDDFDRDGFYGDDDSVYENHFRLEGRVYERDRDWEWDQDDEDDSYHHEEERDD